MGGGDYQRLRLPKQLTTTTEGYPEIPVIRQLIAIPECDEVNITFQTNSPVYFHNYTVYPAPAYQEVQNPDGTVYMEEVFTINQTAYNTNSFTPQVTAEIIQVGNIRSQRMAEIWIYPVQFNPVTEQLQVFTDIEVSLSFTNPTTDVSVNTGIFSNICQNVMLNYTEGGIGASINDRSSSTGTVSWIEVTDTSGEIEADYLIIAAPAFFNSQNADLQALADHRANYNGFDVAIVNVAHVISDAVGYPYEIHEGLEDYIDEQRIRNFLQSVYLNGEAHNTYDGKLGYVLLVGDDGEFVSDEYKVVSGLNRSYIPEWDEWSSKNPSDYNYTCVVPQGNFNWGDFFIGRFSVDSNEKLSNIVSKTINYETIYQFGLWKDNIMLIAGIDSGDLQEAFNETTDNIYSMIPDSYNISKYKASELGGENTRDLIVNGLNEGQLLTHYYGHGGRQHWSGEIFPVSAFQEIENPQKQGVIISTACATGWLDWSSDCMAEYFTTANIGSVMFVGASRVIYESSATPFALYINEAIWNNFSHIGGEFVMEAQIKVSGSKKINNFGDPALNLMAHGYQITEDVTLNGEYNISTDITITNNATVTISNGSKIHFDTNGKFIIDEEASMVIGNNVIISRISEDSDISIYGDMELTGKLTSEANILIHNGGNFLATSDARLKLTSDAGILVKQGGTFNLDNCATFEQVSDGILQVNANGNLCIAPNAILDVPGHSAFNISSQANIPGDCVNPFHVVPPSYKITESNQTWSEVEYNMFRNLEIHPGANLLLEDVNLSFLNNRKIIIKTNGALNIDGGVLTNHSSSCHDNNFWQGLWVSGNPDLPQTYQYQGALIVSNGTVIKNAVIAIQVGSQHSGIFGDQGGIVQVNNAQFINNQRDIEFNSYQNTNSQGQPIDNISYFHHCQFTTNDNTLFSTHHENVKLSGVQGVVFNHASFTDARTNLDLSGSNGRTGILGSNAKFMVYNSDFDQLKYGIYATSANPNRFFKVYNTDFSSYRGIYFNGMDNVTIKNNQFLVKPGYEYSGSRCNDTYGIYIDQSANFAVENNIFLSSSDGSTHCGSLGIIANNTGNQLNEIYRNNFTAFSIAIEAIGKNKGINLHEGLLLKCNIFEENAFDIYVAPGKTDSRPVGIRELHGYATNPNTSTLSGNLFGNESKILISNFFNDGESISYFHHNLKEDRVKPKIWNGDFQFYEIQSLFYDYNQSCPAKIDLTPYNDLITEKQDAQTHYEETSVLLQAHVDDGNTQLMTQQVEMAGEGDAYYTYQYLLQTSPYLSEEVLTSLGAKEEGFNNAMIRDVMVENPQAAKSEEVNLALDSRIDQLPAYMRWQIKNGLFKFSEKEIMEHFMAYQKTRHDQALNQIIMGIIHEQEGFENAPSLDQLLAQIDDVRYQYLLAELKFAEEDYAAGLQQLNHIAQQYESDENALMAHQEMTDFYNLLAQWSNHEDHPGFTNLPGEVLLQLESYLEATPRVAGKALSLLMLNDAIVYEEPILYPQEDMLPKTDPVTGPVIAPDVNSELRFALFPNPSKDYLTLDWCIESPRLAESGRIEFRNATGVLVHTMATHIPCNQQIVPLDGWKSGTYTATLILNNQLRKTISFVVAK